MYDQKKKWKKHLALSRSKTYNIAGSYYYGPNFRKKTELFYDISQKILWKPFDPFNVKKNSLEVYMQRWAKEKKI